MALLAAREASRALNEAKHRAAGKTITCAGCGSNFCPLYGTKLTGVCPECRPVLNREHARATKLKRHKRIKSGVRELVIRRKVFERDGWSCRLCGIATPRALMGAMAHNAPELDHIVPVSRGGNHTYANTQCLCRSCNGWKAARTMEEAVAALAA